MPNKDYKQGLDSYYPLQSSLNDAVEFCHTALNFVEAFPNLQNKLSKFNRNIMVL